MEDLASWKNNRARQILLIVLPGIALILPSLHFVINLIPGLPPDSLPLRLITTAIILCIGVPVLVNPNWRRFSSLALETLVTILLLVDVVLILQSGNNAVHMSAGLLSIFGALITFSDIRRCLASYSLAFLFHLAYSLYLFRWNDPGNLTTLFIFFNAYGLSFFFCRIQLVQAVADFHARREIFELKARQDGDYYLSSVLLDPLLTNRSASRSFRFDFHVDQKKKFRFQENESSIGGDFCLTADVTIAGESYAVFCNGDAMGKSSQGASGALATASVLNAILERKISPDLKGPKAPAIWLVSVFRELQKLLLTFDGSMYVSCVLGIIHERSGVMHYFNAEHPFCVLIRDGRVTFAEEEISSYKLGVPFNTTPIVYRRLLQPGDKFIAASDGRDDLILPDGRIAHDHVRFRELAEKSGGDLESLVHQIRSAGEITDDLSILMVTCLPR